ncbi:MAG TPA: PfkB family carbohydrate kinase [Gaiellaceae bacterium]|nr:PfkB family carbohydrate kinase [Gaiellaceae bacterium]
MAVRFLAVGELLVDVVAAGAGHGARIRVRPAGSAYNAAVAAAAAGAEASVVGTVGDDAAGRMIVRELEARGVQPLVAVVEGGSTGTFLLADGGISVDRGVSHRPGPAGPVEADVVLVSGYLPLAGEVLARASGRWVMLDAARLDELPAGGNAVVANEETAHRLTGLEGDDAARALGEGRELACVTLGARGAVAVVGDRVEHVRPATSAADAPGSGDVFAATLLVALAQGDDLADALTRATGAAVDSLA